MAYSTGSGASEEEVIDNDGKVSWTNIPDRPALKGPKGPEGDKGVQGDPGDQGPRGIDG